MTASGLEHSLSFPHQPSGSQRHSPHMPDVTTLDLAWLQFEAPPPNAQVPLILNVLGGQTFLFCTPHPCALPSPLYSPQTFWKRRDSHLSQLLNISSHLSSRCRATSTGIELSLRNRSVMKRSVAVVQSPRLLGKLSQPVPSGSTEKLEIV